MADQRYVGINFRVENEERKETSFTFTNVSI
jgi:hypothetical protein